MVVGDGAVEMAHSGSLRPWPVTVQTIRRTGRDLTRLGLLEQTGDAGRAAQLDEDTDLAGQQPVRGQDLPVGDRGDQAAGGVPGVERLGPAGRVADPDRGGDRRRLARRPRPLTIGAAPAAWKPNIRGSAVALPAAWSSW